MYMLECLPPRVHVYGCVCDEMLALEQTWAGRREPTHIKRTWALIDST